MQLPGSDLTLRFLTLTEPSLDGRKDRQRLLWLDQREKPPDHKTDGEKDDCSLDADEQFRPGHSKWAHWKKKSMTSTLILNH